MGNNEQGARAAAGNGQAFKPAAAQQIIKQLDQNRRRYQRVVTFGRIAFVVYLLAACYLGALQYRAYRESEGLIKHIKSLPDIKPVNFNEAGDVLPVEEI